jgi:hypothetical protein
LKRLVGLRLDSDFHRVVFASSLVFLPVECHQSAEQDPIKVAVVCEVQHLSGCNVVA